MKKNIINRKSRKIFIKMKSDKKLNGKDEFNYKCNKIMKMI